MAKKRALITGITGQDGSYLAELLLSKNYEVYGVVRKSSQRAFDNIAHVQDKINLFYSDLLDPVSLKKIFKVVSPDEIYNLASQSSPGESFKQPVYTAQITGLGAHRVIETAKDVCPKARFYQASSSEMFGWAREVPQNEETPFNPANPYAAAKLYAHSIARIYRKSYDMFISCGILFNHESPRRGLEFVTQKIAYAAACAKLGIDTSKHLNEEGEPIVKGGKVALGNLAAERDWGFAGDYVKAMWLSLQKPKANDFVVATGVVHKVSDFCREAFAYVGLDYKKFVVVDKRFIRPTETGPLIGDSSFARRTLGWKPEVDFNHLVALMVDANINRLGGQDNTN